MAFNRLSRGRLGNHGAFRGARRTSPGNAPLAAVPASSPFISTYVPIAWAAEIQVFGSLADYWPDGDAAQAVTLTLIWKDGAADEEVSPGRYSHALVNNADLPRPPKVGDVISQGGAQFDVVRILAYTYGICTVVLQEHSD